MSAYFFRLSVLLFAFLAFGPDSKAQKLETKWIHSGRPFSEVRSADISTDGKAIALIGNADIAIVNAQTSGYISYLYAFEKPGYVRHAAFWNGHSSQMLLLVTGFMDGAICSWDFSTDSLAQIKLSAPSDPRKILVSPDGNLLVISNPNSVEVFALPSGEKIFSKISGGMPYAMTFASDSKKLACVISDSLFEISLDSRSYQYVGYAESNYTHTVAYTSSNDTLIAVGNHAERWSVSGHRVKLVDFGVNSLEAALAADQNTLLVLIGGDIEARNATSFAVTKRWPRQSSPVELMWNPKQNQVLLTYIDGQTDRITLDNNTLAKLELGQRDRVQDMAFVSDSTFASATEKGDVTLVNTETGVHRMLLREQSLTYSISTLTSFDGLLVASTGRTSTTTPQQQRLLVWDDVTQNQPRQIELGEHWSPTAVALNSEFAYVGYLDGRIDRVALADGQIDQLKDSNGRRIEALAISPSGQHLAIGRGGEANVIEITTGLEWATFFQSGNLYELIFVSDSLVYAASSSTAPKLQGLKNDIYVDLAHFSNIFSGNPHGYSLANDLLLSWLPRSGSIELLNIDRERVVDSVKLIDSKPTIMRFSPSGTRAMVAFENKALMCLSINSTSDVKGIASLRSVAPYPNPFQSTTVFPIGDGKPAELRIYSVLGAEVQLIVRPANSTASLEADLSNQPNGCYRYTLTVDGQATSGLLVKQF